MKDKLYNYFKNLYNNNKIGHAFLICNCDLSFISDELTFVISDFFFSHSIDINNNEDILLITPENNVIKKEKIQFIQDNVLKTSQSNNIKVYIINGVEKMNDYAANSLLKLLEEPEKNIYAFLISNNVSMVMKTIYSRCQILNFYNEDVSKNVLKNIEEENLNDIIKLIKIIEEEKEKSISKYSFIVKKIKEREFFRTFLYVMLFIYRDSLSIILKKKTNYFKEDELFKIILNNNNKESIIYKLTLINKHLELVDFNLNTNMLLDRFIIDLVGDNCE